MKKIIEKLNKTAKDVAIAQAVSSSVGIVGGVIAIGCLIVAPFTFGTSLMSNRWRSSFGPWSGNGHWRNIAGIVIDKGEMGKAKTCIEKDEVLFVKVAKGIAEFKSKFHYASKIHSPR